MGSEYKVGDRVRVVGRSSFNPAEFATIIKVLRSNGDDPYSYRVSQDGVVAWCSSEEIEPWPDTPAEPTRPAFTREELARDAWLKMLGHPEHAGHSSKWYAETATDLADAFLAELNKEPADAE
jgi:hypothetical protein